MKILIIAALLLLAGCGGVQVPADSQEYKNIILQIGVINAPGR